MAFIYGDGSRSAPPVQVSTFDIERGITYRLTASKRREARRNLALLADKIREPEELVLLAKRMTQDCSNSPWVTDFVRANARRTYARSG